MDSVFEKINLYIILFVTIVLLFSIKTMAFSSKLIPTCNNFVLNVYLYLALSICLLGISSYGINSIFDKSKQNIPLSPKEIYDKLGGYILLSIIMSFILIFMIAFSPIFSKDSYIYYHVLWFLFIVSFSFMIYPQLKSINSYKYVDDSILITSTIFLTMSSVVYLFPSFFGKTYNFMSMGLLIGLISIIIIELLGYFFYSNSSNYMDFVKGMSYVVIVLFSLFVSYDTKRIMVLEQMCKNMPNYPKLSVDFFLDIVNLFSRILFLKSND